MPDGSAAWPPSRCADCGGLRGLAECSDCSRTVCERCREGAVCAFCSDDLEGARSWLRPVLKLLGIVLLAMAAVWAILSLPS